MKKQYLFLLSFILISSISSAQCLSDTSKANNGHGYVGSIDQTRFFYHYWTYKTDKGYLNTLLILNDSVISPQYDICLANDHSTVQFYSLAEGKRQLITSDTGKAIPAIPGSAGFLKKGELNSWTLEKLSSISSLVKLYVSGNHLYFQFIEKDPGNGIIVHKVIYAYENGAFVLKKEESDAISPNGKTKP